MYENACSAFPVPSFRDRQFHFILIVDSGTYSYISPMPSEQHNQAL